MTGHVIQFALIIRTSYIAMRSDVFQCVEFNYIGNQFDKTGIVAYISHKF